MSSAPVYGARVAVVGAGISGLASAYLLARRYDVTLFEAADYPGGHTNTVDVTLDGVTHPVDTGFLVLNDRTYPNLIKLFEELNVATHPSDMSFSVSLDDGRLEWAGSDLNTVFAQRRNIFSPSFIGMLRDIVRFNSSAQRHLDMAETTGCSLNELLLQGGYGITFRNNYLLPMSSAIWSSAAADILNFPAATFLRFCVNHGLLQVRNRPQWRTVVGGGREYVGRMIRQIPGLRLNSRVLGISRNAGSVSILTASGAEQFDAVIMATHAPDSLRMLANPDRREQAILGAVRYQKNTAVLHTDASLLPRRRRVWSAWNYLGANAAGASRPVCVSYLLNQLQPLPFSTPLVVTLNPIEPPAPEKLLSSFEYAHPILDLHAIAAQTQLSSLQGLNGTWHVGAWTGYGFHEDGLKSALRIAKSFGVSPEWAKL
ncbi:NAD(P)/FAD-dependent oxidoreductase [Paracandidimonas soli]|uniref:Putative NAD/FAD-binding protein n=1 Tax=Paracandidimonas soli TaxID=1917182 RepID=A0A4R3V6A6_9BURK|nr:FAD-dependent oxidoreductase [Paracandidimonas soli]TCU98943.1 putative NAD/FAD-binding protein [Paracandidimonas soli]